MKTKFLLFLSLVFLGQSLHALTPNAKRMAYEHLYEVNIQWQYFKAAAPKEDIHFEHDIDRIAYHLTQVEAYLRNNQPKGISSSALKNRLELLDQLKTYASRKVFPQNIYHKERTPYFIDHRGVHCAVGYLIKVSGHADLAEQIKQEQNYDYLRNIKTPGVSEWAKEYGFSFKELEWIQPGYSYYDYIPIDYGIDGNVVDMEEVEGKLYLIGQFSQIANSANCARLAVYEDGQLNCVLSSADGGQLKEITDLGGGEFAVSGNIEHAGNNYPFMVLDTAGTSVVHYNVTNRIGAIATAFAKPQTNSTYDFIVAIQHPSAPNVEEIWMLESNSGIWQHQATVHGQLHAIEADYYAGDFDSLTLHQTTGDTTIMAYNAVYYNESADNWSALGTVADLPETVKTLLVDGNRIYFAGMTAALDSSGILITEYMAGNFQTIVTANDMYDSTATTVEGMELFGNTLYFVGDFSARIFIGNIGTNAAKYDMQSMFLDGYGHLDGTVEDIVLFDNEMIVSGDYFVNWDSSQQHYFSKADLVGSTEQISETQLNFSAYPNPTNGQLNLDFKELLEEAVLEIRDLNGRLVLERFIRQKRQCQLDLELAQGVYILQIKTDEKQSSMKIVKQ